MKSHAGKRLLGHGLEHGGPAGPGLLPGRRTLVELAQAPALPRGASVAGRAVGKQSLVEQSFPRVELKPGATPGGGGGGGGRPAEIAARGVTGAGQPLPHLDLIQRALGPARDLSGVKAYVGGAAAEACEQLGADAYTYQGKLAFREYPDLHTATHELVHGQLEGDGQLADGVSEPADAHERRADAIADAVVAGRSIAPLLGPAAGGGLGARPAVQRKKTSKPAVYRTGDELGAQKLTAFDAYAREQADWSTGPEVGALNDALWKLLEHARSTPAFLAGCGPMQVEALLAVISDDTKVAALDSYCGAVHQDRQTVEIEPVDDLERALKMGEALPRLEATPGGPTIQTIMKQTGKLTELEWMIEENAIDPFIKYVEDCDPILHANNGREIYSYLLMKGEGVDPAAYKGKVPRVRNLHRFEKAALDALADHEEDLSKKKPLTLILHSALDHNGAFHRDPELTKVIKHPKNVTIMVEGKETLADVQSDLDPIAQRYGKAGKIDQVMFAGHGNARLMELAGKVEVAGAAGEEQLVQRAENVDLDGNQAPTDALFEELMRHMDPKSPHHRVVFNACLTNSNSVNIKKLDANPATAQQQIREAIAKDGSLATTFKQKAAEEGIQLDARGANGSFGRAGLIDQKRAGLDLVSKQDPHLTSAKLKYVRYGKDPGGVMRAVVEEWGRSSKDCNKAMKARRKGSAPTGWSDRLVYEMMGLILAGKTNADMMNQFAHCASRIDHLRFEDECRVRNMAYPKNAGWIRQIFKGLAKTTEWKTHKYLPLVGYQIWSAVDPGKATSFLEHLGAHFTCHAAAKFVDVPFLADQAKVLDALLPATPDATPPDGQLKLALLDVARRRKNAHPLAIAYLQAVLGDGHRFRDELDLPGKLAGLATETEILVAIDRATPSGPKAPAPNLDVDRDGINDLYVKPLTRTGKIAAPGGVLFEEPDARSERVTVLFPGASVRIIGQLEQRWYACEHDGRVAFAHVTDFEP